MKGKRDEGGGRVLLGDDRGGVAVILRQIRFSSFGVKIPIGLLWIYIYIYIQGVSLL
jgi:hypothetical protein